MTPSSTTEDSHAACPTEFPATAGTPTRSASEARDPPSRDFASLARRITGWTSNLLGTAVVVVASLAVGRQVVQWWRVSPADSATSNSPAASIALPEFGPTQTLALGGGAFALRREELSGDRAAAAAALRDRCRATVPTVADPAAPPDRHEQSLLTRLAGTEPVDAADDWQIFELTDVLPIAVVVRNQTTGFKKGSGVVAGTARRVLRTTTPDPFLNHGDADAPGGMPSALRGHAAPSIANEPQRRVVIWAMAFPSGEAAWTLYLFHAAASAAPAPDAPPLFALPPGSRRTLAMDDQAGGGLTAFAGHGDPNVWVGFFRDWSTRNGWTPVEDWRLAGSFWHARYRRTGRPDDHAVSIHFGPAGGELVGLVCVSPTQHSTMHREGKE